LAGEVLDKQFLPAPGGEVLNKPKGSWVAGNRFWVTDIDVAWVFDLTTRRGRKVALPGAQFANDLAVMATRCTSATTERISSSAWSRPTSSR